MITYNKNAKYEQELLREEERRLVLKAKRDSRKSVRSDSSETGIPGDALKYADDEDSWQQGGETRSGSYPGNQAGSHGNQGGMEAGQVEYEVEKEGLGKQPLHTSLKLKRIVRKAMAEDQNEAAGFAGKCAS